MPALPEAAVAYQPGDYAKFLPDLSGAVPSAGPLWLGLPKDGPLGRVP